MKKRGKIFEVGGKRTICLGKDEELVFEKMPKGKYEIKKTTKDQVTVTKVG